VVTHQKNNKGQLQARPGSCIQRLADNISNNTHQRNIKSSAWCVVEDECYQSVPGGYNLETLTLSLSGGNKKDEHLPPDNTLAILDTPYNNFTKGRVCLGNKQPVNESEDKIIEL